MSDKEIFTLSLYKAVSNFLPNYKGETIEKTSQDVVNYFIDNFKKVGLKRIGKGLVATGLFAIGDHVLGKQGHSTLETICKIGGIGSAFYSLSATRALISAYWHKDFLNEIVKPIIRRYYFVDKYKND